MGLFHRLIRRFLLRDVARIFTHMTSEEQVCLVSCVQAFAKSKAVIAVEIGSYLGASSCCLALGLKNSKQAKLYCVDTWENDAMSEGKRDTYAEFLSNTKRFGDRIVPLRGKSVDVARDFDTSIDLIFFDGDHSYEGVKADVDAWFPKVKSGGTVIMHDIGWAEGVQRVLQEDILPVVEEKGRLPNMFLGIKK